MPPNPTPNPASPSLLSPAAYDDDASLRTPSEQDSDSEDDAYLSQSRTSRELARHDRGVLEDEEEREELLTVGPSEGGGGLRRFFGSGESGSWGRNGSGSVRIGKREKRRRKGGNGRRRRGRERGELMFEMEEGYRDDTSSLLSTPSEDEGDEGEGMLEKDGYVYTQPKRISWRRISLVLVAMLVLFFILVLGAYKASSGFRASRGNKYQPLMSNGTALFGPTTVMISLDGFRADFLNRGLTPTLNAFIADGVSPKYMLPSFPSVTFPNHFTLVTGLYPESHGIVGNTFWDPELQEEFYYTHADVSMQAKWWNAEPLWNTAEKQDVRTGIHMWPGSEAHIGGMDPTFVDRFNGSEVLPRKVDRILELLDLPGEEHDSLDVPGRPQFIGAYVPNVDADGHKYGPNSTEIRGTISKVDGMLGRLFRGIQERHLTDIVNIVVVSDHGMATTDSRRLIQLDDYVDLDLVAHLDGWPSRGLRPKNSDDLETLKEQVAILESNYSHAVEVYTKETMPERYHFADNDRIAPLWVIPKTGWAIVERVDFDAQKAVEAGDTYHPRGVHGYDHDHPLMRAIFVARGPAFPHPPNSRVEPFQNVNVYNIICDSLGINPHPNNGSMRLPLQTQGLHSDGDDPAADAQEHPADPPPAATPDAEPTSASESAESSDEATEDTSEGQPQSSAESEDEKGTSWWDALWNKFDDFKQWAGGVVDAVKGGFG